MKKLVFVLGVLLLLCANAHADGVELPQSKEVKFVNPIFYQPLRLISSKQGVVYLYPTFIDIRSPADENIINAMGGCELIENEQDHITLLCVVKYALDDKPRSPEYYTFTIANLLTENCLEIEANITNPKWPNYKNYISYCVTPPASWSETD